MVNLLVQRNDQPEGKFLALEMFLHRLSNFRPRIKKTIERVATSVRSCNLAVRPGWLLHSTCKEASSWLRTESNNNPLRVPCHLHRQVEAFLPVYGLLYFIVIWSQAITRAGWIKTFSLIHIMNITTDKARESHGYHQEKWCSVAWRHDPFHHIRWSMGKWLLGKGLLLHYFLIEIPLMSSVFLK